MPSVSLEYAKLVEVSALDASSFRTLGVITLLFVPLAPD